MQMPWRPHQDGKLSGKVMETRAFMIFLYGRTLDGIAGIEASLNRGRNMGIRTAASQWNLLAICPR